LALRMFGTLCALCPALQTLQWTVTCMPHRAYTLTFLHTARRLSAMFLRPAFVCLYSSPCVLCLCRVLCVICALVFLVLTVYGHAGIGAFVCLYSSPCVLCLLSCAYVRDPWAPARRTWPSTRSACGSRPCSTPLPLERPPRPAGAAVWSETTYEDLACHRCTTFGGLVWH
jgi:hypothetical protein